MVAETPTTVSIEAVVDAFDGEQNATVFRRHVVLIQ
jgi:hypothetical protein